MMVIKKSAHNYIVTDDTFKKERRYQFELTFSPFSLMLVKRSNGLHMIWRMEWQ